MQSNGEHARSNPGTGESVVAHLFKGYRFTVCQTAARAAQALELRRRVYAESGYRVPTPDEYDGRSWLLLAEDMVAGKPVGSLRMTPRFAGPLEAEEYFTLPRRLASPKSIELTRFAILPEYRKGKTFLPIVSLGLFKLVWNIMRSTNSAYMVVSSKPERIWTYQWLRFRRTGLTAQYGKLANAEHELLWQDFRHEATHLDDHPFCEFFQDIEYPEVIMPRTLPAFGVVSAEPPFLAKIA